MHRAICTWTTCVSYDSASSNESEIDVEVDWQGISFVYKALNDPVKLLNTMDDTNLRL